MSHATPPLPWLWEPAFLPVFRPSAAIFHPLKTGISCTSWPLTLRMGKLASCMAHTSMSRSCSRFISSTFLVFSPATFCWRIRSCWLCLSWRDLFLLRVEQSLFFAFFPAISLGLVLVPVFRGFLFLGGGGGGSLFWRCPARCRVAGRPRVSMLFI